MRRALALLGLLACGGSGRAQAVPRVPSPAPTLAAAARPAPPPDALPSLDDLAAHAGDLASGMREAARRESSVDAPAAEVLRADAKDECVRLLFAADVAVRARLEDRAGDALFSLDAPASAAPLAVHGPVCVRKGDAVKVAFTREAAGPPARVRWIAWASP